MDKKSVKISLVIFCASVLVSCGVVASVEEWQSTLQSETSLSLCMEELNGTTFLPKRDKARALELQRRGEDCVKYVGAYNAKKTADAKAQENLNQYLKNLKDAELEEKRIYMQNQNPRLRCQIYGSGDYKEVVCR